MTTTDRADKPDDPMPEQPSNTPPSGPSVMDNVKAVSALLRERFGLGR